MLTNFSSFLLDVGLFFSGRESFFCADSHFASLAFRTTSKFVIVAPSQKCGIFQKIFWNCRNCPAEWCHRRNTAIVCSSHRNWSTVILVNRVWWRDSSALRILRFCLRIDVETILDFRVRKESTDIWRRKVELKLRILRFWCWTDEKVMIDENLHRLPQKELRFWSHFSRRWRQIWLIFS